MVMARDFYRYCFTKLQWNQGIICLLSYFGVHMVRLSLCFTFVDITGQGYVSRLVQEDFAGSVLASLAIAGQPQISFIIRNTRFKF